MTKSHSFGKPERIKRNFEYKRVREKGTSFRDGVFILNILKNNQGRHRLGVSISSSKVSLASKRNRIKRLIREAFRLNKLELKNGTYDITIRVNQAPPYKLDYSVVEQRLRILLKRARAI